MAEMHRYGGCPQCALLGPADRLTRILDQFADRVEYVRVEVTIGDTRIEETVQLRAPITARDC